MSHSKEGSRPFLTKTTLHNLTPLNLRFFLSLVILRVVIGISCRKKHFSVRHRCTRYGFGCAWLGLEAPKCTKFTFLAFPRQWIVSLTILYQQPSRFGQAELWCLQSASVHLLTLPTPFFVLAQTIYMIGWSPHTSQQQPSDRGSGKLSMKDIVVTKG